MFRYPSIKGGGGGGTASFVVLSCNVRLQDLTVGGFGSAMAVHEYLLHRCQDGGGLRWWQDANCPHFY